MKKKILLKSPILTLSGYGHHSRIVFRSLRAYEDYFDLYIQPIPWGQCGWISDDNEERQYIDELINKTFQYQQQFNGHPQYDISVQVTIPNEFKKLAPINIGVTAGIEVENRISPAWIEKSALMDKIIVVSEFAKAGFDNTSYQAHNQQTGQVLDFRNQTPVTTINYPVGTLEKEELKLNLKSNFNFLTVAQNGPRKNIGAIVSWFTEEFLNEPDVGLVLKIFTKNNSLMDRNETQNAVNQVLAQFSQRKCKIYLLHGELSDEQMNSLYTNPKIKALISLSPECYGLPVFEASYNALPIVAPAWGGYLDFVQMLVRDKKKNKEKLKPMIGKVDYTLKPISKEVVWPGVIEEGSIWCYPDKNSVRLRMRDVYKNNSRYKSQAKKLQKHVIENFTEEKIYKQYAEEIYGEPLNIIDKSVLPKVSIYTSVYDGEKTIEEFMKDITRQSIFEDKCELVLVHPKTSPGFEKEQKVIQEYMKKYDNIIYKELEDDPGIYGCWSIGAEMSTGEYLTNANLDDRKSVNSLEEFAKELYTNEDVDVIYADSFVTDKLNETFEQNSSNGRAYNFPEYDFKTLKMMSLCHQAPMYRRKLHDKYGYFDSKYRYSGDWEFWLRCGSKGIKFKKFNKKLNLYCFNPNGLTTDPSQFPAKQKEEMEVFNKYKDVELKEEIIEEDIIL